MGDQFGYTNAIGLAIVIAGVALFNIYKLQKIKKVGACVPQGVTYLGMGIPARWQDPSNRTFSHSFFLQGEIVMKVAAGRGSKNEADNDVGTAGDTEMQSLLKVDAQSGGDASNVVEGGASLATAGNGRRSGGVSPPRQKLTLS